MSWLNNILASLGKIVDAAVPVAVGSRTKIAAVACPVLAFLAPAVVAIPVLAPVAAALPYVQAALCSATPLFALAGLVRQ